ncbi:S9 family peptidase [Aliidiomarina minuta]|uniref:S9 family peptidase n=1 Tax=Aliidiomarina minuta TaxID=880057 RepID=A0A432W6S6_9GAMM|nr:prolyl oligopeptidase family serine peptidase [Aliidiomarina minuta]RUO25783.1 S9 family peptidase [Aliidiomarina minuta]
MKTKLYLAIASALLTVSCAATDSDVTEASGNDYAPAEYQPQATSTTSDQRIALTQIMADTEWVARSPENPYWSYDGNAVFFERKREGSPLRDLHSLLLNQQDEVAKVDIAELHEHDYSNAVYNDNRDMQAYVFEGNIFVRNLQSGQLRQLTRDSENKSNLQFLNDGRLAFRKNHTFMAVDLDSGFTETLASLRMSREPQGVTEPGDYLAREEVDLIEYNQVQRRQRQERHERQQALQERNPSLAPKPFYLGEGKQVAEVSLSPAGTKMLVAVTDSQSWRGEGDLMPRYVTESGRIENQEVRRRVADAEPVHHELYLLDLTSGEKSALSYDSLPGFDEDVLASVREENYAERGESYESEPKERAIEVISRWSAGQGNINWTQDGEQVAIMFRAWDNKDRWIATLDFDNAELVNQHRLHDEAWINRIFNDFDWIPGQNAIWYLSEEDGYSHLYVRDLDSATTRQLTQGQYIVDEVTMSQAGDFLYYHANKPSPGNYEIYRVAIASGEQQQLTDLGGINSAELSPAEDQLLITHSSALRPPELYVQPIGTSGQAQRLTHTISREFKSLPWKRPDIVAVPSNHVDEPIYSRVYLPDNFDPNRAEQYPAVVFIHGAGYLQNAHGGWSNYSREFMFHNKLTQQGYVVLDLDFRGSRGYGRDWRTAVYRQMGWPEVEDLVDVVSWMGENVNVDVERVGTYGGSYGGFLTFMSLFNEPGLFKAGAALRPVTDWAHYNTGYTSNILNLPQDDAIAYRRSSPIYFAEGLEDALLISAPMVDDNVFFQDSVRLVQRLIELEKEDFETAIFPVEPHGFVQPSSWLDQYRRIYKLFEDNLK